MSDAIGRTGKVVFETVDSPISYVRIKSEIGDPIQLSDLHPVACESLVRMGNPNDGGYAVPLDAVTAARALLSFGLSHNWTFERDFKQRNPDALVHCYDHTVSLSTAFLFSIGQLLRFILLFRTGALRKTFTWLDYKLFFRSNVTHFKQRIGPDGQDNSATIDDVFSRLPVNCPAFVKMDIEGSEYLVLDDLLRRSGNIVAIAIEFHDVDAQPGRFNSIVEKIKREFHIVHIHGNNMGGIASNFPKALELTFLHKRFFDSAPSLSGSTYPTPGLDHPNNPRLSEIAFEF
jgi:Methyltransferase FkbM domain